MHGNFPACLKVTLAHEGEWADHKDDPGGATMKGVTIGRYRDYYPKATKADLRKISAADLERIYRLDYWSVVRGDDLPYGVDLATFDFGVNSGPARAAKYLQGVVGVAQDGRIGARTLDAVMWADGKSVIQKLCGKRLGFVQGLSTFKVFGKGWSRRIADIEAKGVAMWLAHGKALTPVQRGELAHEAEKAGKKSTAQNTGAGGAVAGGGGSAVAADPNWLLIAGVAAFVVVAIILAVKARQNKHRQEAYRLAAIA